MFSALYLRYTKWAMGYKVAKTKAAMAAMAFKTTKGWTRVLLIRSMNWKRQARTTVKNW